MESVLSYLRELSGDAGTSRSCSQMTTDKPDSQYTASGSRTRDSVAR